MRCHCPSVSAQHTLGRGSITLALRYISQERRVMAESFTFPGTAPPASIRVMLYGKCASVYSARVQRPRIFERGKSSTSFVGERATLQYSNVAILCERNRLRRYDVGLGSYGSRFAGSIRTFAIDGWPDSTGRDSKPQRGKEACPFFQRAKVDPPQELLNDTMTAARVSFALMPLNRRPRG